MHQEGATFTSCWLPVMALIISPTVVPVRAASSRAIVRHPSLPARAEATRPRASVSASFDARPASVRAELRRDGTVPPRLPPVLEGRLEDVGMWLTPVIGVFMVATSFSRHASTTAICSATQPETAARRIMPPFLSTCWNSAQAFWPSVRSTSPGTTSPPRVDHTMQVTLFTEDQLGISRLVRALLEPMPHPSAGSSRCRLRPRPRKAADCVAEQVAPRISPGHYATAGLDRQHASGLRGLGRLWLQVPSPT